jgi:hypothetical protein
MHNLEEKVEEEQWPKELVKTIKGFQKEEKQVFVKLRKRKDLDEELSLAAFTLNGAPPLPLPFGEYGLA